MLINPYVFGGGGGGGGGGPYVFVDADAANYAGRVATADGQELEDTTKAAIDTLFLTLKNTITWRSNSITLWDKLNYSLPMRGPLTLDGALIPLQNRTAATAIQSGNFTYNRKTGIEVTSIATQHPVLNIGN